MKCDQCSELIKKNEERQHLGQTLCEDCLMEVLSPVKACDPWAIHSAKSFELHNNRPSNLNPTQTEIIQILETTGGLESKELLQRLKGKISLSQLEREFAVLKHMERVRAEKNDDKILLMSC